VPTPKTRTAPAQAGFSLFLPTTRRDTRTRFSREVRQGAVVSEIHNYTPVIVSRKGGYLALARSDAGQGAVQATERG
jgi:hypothetical protein